MSPTVERSPGGYYVDETNSRSISPTWTTNLLPTRLLAPSSRHGTGGNAVFPSSGHPHQYAEKSMDAIQSADECGGGGGGRRWGERRPAATARTCGRTAAAAAEVVDPRIGNDFAAARAQEVQGTASPDDEERGTTRRSSTPPILERRGWSRRR